MPYHPEDRLLSAVVVMLIALLIAVPILMIILMAAGVLGNTGFDMMDMGGSWWAIVIPAFGLLAIALVLLLILGRPAGGPLPPVPYPPFPAHQDEPLAILDRRLASGEITLDEYLKVREHLTKK